MMKHLLILTFLIGTAANASSIPQELLNLLPENTTSVRLVGKTLDEQKCMLDISASNHSFSSTIFVLRSDGSLDAKRMARFQIGFGHELQNVEKNGPIVSAKSLHEADESYSSDSRATLVADKDASIRSVQILNEESGFFGWSKVRDETCLVEKQ